MPTITLHSFAFGLTSLNSRDEIIEVFYPRPLLAPDPALIDIIARTTKYPPGENQVIPVSKVTLSLLQAQLHKSGFVEQAQLVHRLSTASKSVIGCFLAEDKKPTLVAEVFLKLHLLSHRLCLPNTLNLEGAFGLLHNLAWTNLGPIPLEELESRQFECRMRGELLEVMSVDKFPKMANYIVPPGVRIAHSARVRLGAYLGEGSTVMHEGFVNFNAGTAGKAMIEGRISAGVWVGQGSDLGGSCSIMGTLSGGGKEIISVGENSLIGANAGIGFSLGDRCIVEAGLYVTAGTKVNLLDQKRQLLKTVKAKELARLADLMFRRNSLTGAVECVPNKSAVSLNESLHAHN